MAAVTQIRNPLGGADNVALTHLLTGEQHTERGRFHANETPVDISDYTITAQGERYDGTVQGDNVSNLVKVPNVPAVDLPVHKIDDANGLWQFTIPSNIIPTGRNPDAGAMTVPVLLVYLTYAIGSSPVREVLKHRWLFTFRRGYA